MPIFSTRSNKREANSAPKHNVPLDSIETLRTRARQRLIGSVVLVALGVIVFTLLFDSQPRPIPVNVPIVIPDRDKFETAATVPVVIPPAQAVTPTVTASAAGATAASAAVQASASLGLKEEIVVPRADKKSEAKAEVKSELVKPDLKTEVVKTETKPAAVVETKPVAKVESKTVPKPVTDEAAKALAILEGKETLKAAPTNPSSVGVTPNIVSERFIVQFGAYAENDKAREARLKVERTGLKTYVHVAETPQGKRIRLRVGPFSTRAEAEKAAEKIKTLNLPVAILTL
jgi:DedD protein